jgi:cell division protein ZapE
MQVVNVDNGTDYRGLALEQAQLYLSPCSPANDAVMHQTFDRLAEMPDQDGLLLIEERKIWAKRRAGGMVWFDFKVLCGGPRSQNDFLEIASQFHTVFLSGVPKMEVRMSSEARRFTWLIDVLYDRRVKLIIQADVEPEQLYTEGPMSHEFPRTASRLREMQSAAFLALGRRVVDTSLT